jgi:hypothetical protein
MRGIEIDAAQILREMREKRAGAAERAQIEAAEEASRREEAAVAMRRSDDSGPERYRQNWSRSPKVSKGKR